MKRLEIVASVIGAIIGLIAVIVGFYVLDALDLPRDVRRAIDFILAGVFVWYGLRFVIAEGVATGVEKGIKAVLTNSSVVRDEISAAISEERESQSQSHDDEDEE